MNFNLLHPELTQPNTNVSPTFNYALAAYTSIVESEQQSVSGYQTAVIGEFSNEKIGDLSTMKTSISMSTISTTSITVYSHVGAVSIMGNRNTMEDYVIYHKIKEGVYIYAVLDGHGGWQIAAYVKHELIRQSSNIPDMKNKKKFNQWIKSVCYDIGKKIYELTELDSIGSTATIVFHNMTTVCICNIGDSKAVVFDKNAKIYLSTIDHNLSNLEEQIRLNLSGITYDENYIEGILNVSRSFGDNDINRLVSDEYNGFYSAISVNPDIYYYNIRKSKQQYIIIGSDGFWNPCVFDNTSNAKFGRTYAFNNMVEIINTKSLQDSMNILVEKIYYTGINDNISAILIKLN